MRSRMIAGYYYLHTNGSLIYKNVDSGVLADFRDSDFVRHFWRLDIQDRESAWSILIEASALGAKPSRIDELAILWKCDDTDAQTYAEKVGCVLKRDGDQWCATRIDFINLQESQSGFGTTCLEAMVSLCKELGFKAQKLWGGGFAHLLAEAKEAEDD